MMKVSCPLTLGASILSFNYLPKTLQNKIRKHRVKRLVEYSRKNSPYFKELYKDLPKNYKFCDLPITNKQMLNEHFDDWCTDPSITKKSVFEYMSCLENRKLAFQDKYMVATTSGSSGFPAIIISDETSMIVSEFLSFIRGVGFRFPLTNVCIAEGFGIDNGAIDQNVHSYPFLKHLVKITDAMQPMAQLLDDLNKFKPKTLIGYTGVMSILADQALEGKLKLKPKVVITGGERLPNSTRDKISKAFGCPVHSLYASTEAGTIAFECKHNHLHTNDDWVILESVDANNKPVPFGTFGAKILLTNLSNYVQPIIRFEMGDRIIVHESCDCGKPGHWVEVIGRSNDLLKFSESEKNIEISPMIIYDIIDVAVGSKIKLFQLILHDDNNLEFRLNCFNSDETEEIFQTTRSLILNYLKDQGVTKASMYLSDKSPELDKNTGKFKQIYQENKVTSIVGRKNFVQQLKSGNA